MQEILANLIKEFESSWFYTDFCANLPEGLNNPTLDFILTIIVLLIIGLTIKEFIVSFILRRRNANRAEKLKQDKLISEQERREHEAKQEKMMNQLIELNMSGAMHGQQGMPSFIDDVPPRNEDAYIDKSLNVLNRNAYERDFAKFPAEDFGVVMFDINDLKKTNDTLGHKYGDKLLKAVSGLISEIFGSCYRLGGDEFIYMFNGEGYQSIERKIDKIRMRMNTLTSNDEDHIVYQAGIGYCINDGTMKKIEVQEAADAEMYKNKRVIKEAKPDTSVADLYAPKKIQEEANSATSESTASVKKVIDPFEDTPLTDGIDSDENVYDLSQTEEINDRVKHLQTQVVSEELPDTQTLLKEKMEDIKSYTTPSSSVENEFASILSGLQNQKEEEAKLQQLSEEEEKIKAANMALLEKKAKSNLKMSSDGRSLDNSAVIRAQERELERRREEARRQEDAEAKKRNNRK